MSIVAGWPSVVCGVSDRWHRQEKKSNRNSLHSSLLDSFIDREKTRHLKSKTKWISVPVVAQQAEKGGKTTNIKSEEEKVDILLI